MNTSDKFLATITNSCRQVGELFSAIGTLFKGVNGFITAGIALLATIMGLLIFDKPDKREEQDTHPSREQTEVLSKPKPEPLPAPVQPVNQRLDDQPVTTPTALNIAGAWFDDEGSKIRVEQYASTIRLSIVDNSESGVPIEMSGSGELADQSSHLELTGQALGQILGKIPADITFLNDRKAILTLNMNGLPISAALHR